MMIAFLALVWASLLFRSESRGQGLRSAAEVSLNYLVPLPMGYDGPQNPAARTPHELCEQRWGKVAG